MRFSTHNCARRKYFRKNLIILLAASFSALSNGAHAHVSVLRIHQHVLSSLWYFSPSDRSVPHPASRTLVARSRGPVVLKSGRNRRYRPVARPVIVGRAVTNQVSGPRPSGHFPAPTWGPCRPSVSPRPPGGSRSGPRGPAKALPAFPLPSPPRRRSSAVLRRGNPALSRGFPFVRPVANRLPRRDVRAFLGLLDVACRDGSVWRDPV